MAAKKKVGKKCCAKTTVGTKCKRVAAKGSKYCSVHKKAR
jgi:hypothetical protein